VGTVGVILIFPPILLLESGYVGKGVGSGHCPPTGAALILFFCCCYNLDFGLTEGEVVREWVGTVAVTLILSNFCARIIVGGETGGHRRLLIIF
jgi:hypothetical protein